MQLLIQSRNKNLLFFKKVPTKDYSEKMKDVSCGRSHRLFFWQNQPGARREQVRGAWSQEQMASTPAHSPLGASPREAGRKPGSLHPTLRVACWGRQSSSPDHQGPSPGKSSSGLLPRFLLSGQFLRHVCLCCAESRGIKQNKAAA